MKRAHYLSRHGRGCDCAHCGDVEAANERAEAAADDYIEAQPYEWKREQCEIFRREKAARTTTLVRFDFKRGHHAERFSEWLRDRVADMLREFDDRAAAGWY